MGSHPVTTSWGHEELFSGDSGIRAFILGSATVQRDFQSGVGVITIYKERAAVCDFFFRVKCTTKFLVGNSDAGSADSAASAMAIEVNFQVNPEDIRCGLQPKASIRNGSMPQLIVRGRGLNPPKSPAPKSIRSGVTWMQGSSLFALMARS